MSPTHDSSAAEPTRSIGSDRIGRRSKTKGDRRQQLILDEAEHLLEQRSSWRAVGIDDGATAAEISRSAFHFYYDSKDALLAALVEQVMTETALAMPGGWISRSPDVRPRDALRATFTWIVVIWRDHGRVLAAASSIWNAVPEHRDQWEALQSRLITAFNRQIDLERRAGQPLAVPGLDSVALSTLLMWMAERVVSIPQAGTATDLSYDDLIEALTSVRVRSVYLHDRPDP